MHRATGLELHVGVIDVLEPQREADRTRADPRRSVHGHGSTGVRQVQVDGVPGRERGDDRVVAVDVERRTRVGLDVDRVGVGIAQEEVHGGNVSEIH